MNNEDPFARRKIMLVASELVKERGSKDLQFRDVAERANVDLDVIEEFFDSRTQLIAEVQMANYFVMVEPIHLGLSRIEECRRGRRRIHLLVGDRGEPCDVVVLRSVGEEVGDHQPAS